MTICAKVCGALSGSWNLGLVFEGLLGISWSPRYDGGGRSSLGTMHENDEIYDMGGR